MSPSPVRTPITRPSAVRIFLNVSDEVIEQIVTLHGGTVALADGAVTDIPGCPPGDTHLFHFLKVVGRVLIDRKDLTDTGLPCLLSQRADREFPLREVVLTHYVIDAYRVGGSAVLIFRPRIDILVAVLKNVLDIGYEIFVCLGHE